MGYCAFVAGIIAIVPMRGGSERVPKKNLKPCAGRPLYHYIVDTLLACDAVTTVVIDSDSEAILADARASFPKVLTRRRPAALGQAEVTMNAVLKDTLAHLDGDRFLQTHSTNPLLTTATVRRAIDAFDATTDHDSLMSVTRLHTRLWTESGPLNHDPSDLRPTQDLAPIFEENSCLYLFDRAAFEARGNRVGARPLLFEIDPIEAIDIDTPADFRLAEALILSSD